MSTPDDLAHALASALNRFSAENGSNTPDFILADYLLACLGAFNEASRARERWYADSPNSTMREFVGWLSVDIPELHQVELPQLADSLARFLARRAAAPGGASS